MKLLLFSSFIFCLGFLNAQLSMPYVTGFDNASEQSGWEQFRKGTISQFEKWSYASTQPFSPPTYIAHNYPVGGTQVMDDWFVSPAFNIAAGGTLDSVRYAFSGFGTPQTADTICIYLLNGAKDPALATSAEILYQFTGSNYPSDNTWRVLAPVPLTPRPGTCYLAFRYKTINNWLDVRFDNVGISRVSLTGIDEQAISAVEVSPNPAVNKQVRVRFDAAQLNKTSLKFELYDAAGQLVYASQVVDQQVLDLPVTAGFYAYQLQGAAGNVSIGKIVIE